MNNNKKIFSISMVKNEMDVIESFIRYHINIFDGMIILDNGSTDNTLKILSFLKNEGLPIYIFEDDNREYNQAIKMNYLLLKAINEFKADIIVPLDADEFLTSSNSGNPRKMLEEMKPSTFYMVKWKTYIPDFDKNKNEKFIPAKITFARENKLDKHYKVIIPQELVKNYDAKLIKGNHDIIYDKKYKELIKKFFITELNLAHFPVRSKEQFISKISLSWLNSLCDINRAENQSWHLKKMFNNLKKNKKIENKDVINYAKTYALKTEEKGITVENDPINLSFCKNIEIKYTIDKINPMINLLEAYEWLSLSNLNLKKEKLKEEKQYTDLKEKKIETERQLRRKIEEYENSTSWIITSPLRKCSSTFKKYYKTLTEKINEK
jgi:hypothetical protein